MLYKNILDLLYVNYFLKDAVSDVTSSHWKWWHDKFIIKKCGELYFIRGGGFGDFKPSKILNKLYQLPQSILLKSLLKKHNVDSDIIKCGTAVASRQKRIIDFDCIKQIITIDMLVKRNLLRSSKIITVIGDGYGFMTALIKECFPKTKVICVNLGKTLFFDVFYVMKAFPDAEVLFLRDELDKERLDQSSVIFIEAEKYHLLYNMQVDFFINIASMQEMDMNVINKYFEIMRSSIADTLFYCCNRVEKQLPDGSLIKFFDYPWSDKNIQIVDELCPWYQSFPVPLPPFWKTFDGPIYHRITKLSKM